MFDSFSWSDLLSSAVKSFVPSLAQTGVTMLADKLFPPSRPQFLQGPAPAPPPPPLFTYPTPQPPLDLRTPEMRTAEGNRLAAEQSRLQGLTAAEADLAAARAGTMTPDQSGALQEIIRQTRAGQAARGLLDTGAGAALESEAARKYREGLIGNAFDRLNALSQGYTTPLPMQAQAPLAPQITQPPYAVPPSQFMAAQSNPWAAITASTMGPAAAALVGRAVGAETPEQKRRREMQEQADIWRKALYPPPGTAY